MAFDPARPFNDLPLLPPEFNFDDVEILKKVNRANIAISNLNIEAKSIPESNVLIEPLAFRESVASSEIENIITTIDEAFESSYIDDADLKNEQKETKYYRQSLLSGFNEIKTKGFLNTNSFIELQSILEPEKPGIRKVPGVSIKNVSTGNIIYTPPEGENLIRTLLANFELYFNDPSDEIDSLIKAAVLHYQLEAIHPFLDGNGRTGRILIVLYLCLVKKLDLPILFISGYINRHRSDYYKLLRDVTDNNNWKTWTLFILDAIEEQSVKTTHSVSGIKELMINYREIMNRKLPRIYSDELVNYLFSFPYYSQKSMQTDLNISRNTASKYFSELVKTGIMTEKKYKNDKIYYCPAFHELLK